MPPLTLTTDVALWLANDAPVALGVSGGKDGTAMAFAVQDHLDCLGHRGPRLLVHADLGRVEWQDSLPSCRRLAEATGLDLVVVRRQKGDMLDRWQQRWDDNCRRYSLLECVKLIMPWSSPEWRFCTSEMKVEIICRELVRRWPGCHRILSASGIRADESTRRSKAPVAAPQPRLRKVKADTAGLDWHPILRWTEKDVWAEIARRGFEPHEAYAKYGSSRVSCCFCIMSSAADLVAAATCPDNADLYRAMVQLEINSTFAFQGDAWLGDVAPKLLYPEQRHALPEAKRRARLRAEAESRIPDHLLYTKGWPTCVPTRDEAELLAGVRRDVAKAVGLAALYTDGEEVRARYQELMDTKQGRG